MPDPYAFPGASEAPSRTHPHAHEASPEASRVAGRRAALWTLLVLSAVANSVTSAMAVPVGISLALGGLTLVAIVALVVSHTRTRS
ncbi:hypothetical protein ACGIF2_09080 [Cellulomonas sp. P22]|uniref:hypothetical protein n=1 Tax=Cellulomonas sp. P22 TaxID=3373189 RepID=UPI0037A2116B